MRRSTVLVAIGILIPLGTAAGQIPGVTTPLPPEVDRTFELVFGNDFLGRGGEFDDHRTQQLGLVAAVAPRWSVVVDYSFLTLTDPIQGDPGRLDQLSASVGYRLLRAQSARVTQDVEVGVGLRTYGEMAGQRMQNGFHRLLGVTPTLVPYTPEERTDVTLWVTLPHHGVLARDVRLPLLGDDWSFGYWGRGSSLLTTDGQWDANLGVTAVAGRRWFQLWLGLQGDVRSGYDRDNVTRETADVESGVGVVYGLRLGPLILESAQQFDGDAAYGHARLVSTGDPLAGVAPGVTVEVQSAISVPDVYASFQARLSRCGAACSSRWRRAVLLEYRFGKPQYGGDPRTYVPTWQLSAAYEVEAPAVPVRPWLTGFGALGVGWREESLEGLDPQWDGLGKPSVVTRSEAVGRAGLVADLGLRVSAGASQRPVGLMLQLGVSAWLPTSGASVDFAGRVERLQRASLVLVPGLLVRVRLGSAR
jgi:hypothetical protein